MLDVEQLRQLEPKIIVIGSHPAIIQSILDYDYLSGRQKPSVVAIVASGRKFQRFFYGEKELLLPIFQAIEQIPTGIREEINMFVNVSSGRRVLVSTVDVIAQCPNLKVGTIFAEGVPEKHAIELANLAALHNISVIGPASVGVVIPSLIKLGAIGGISHQQIQSSGILEDGHVAVLSASGGMVNEIINIVSKTPNRLSFALSFGGDRFPILEPVEALKTAEKDQNTKVIIYYGELGGEDEYKLSDLIKKGKITKKVICYVAGVVSDLFETPPQFGHAKAMAGSREESANSKREALRDAGAVVPESFSEFVDTVNKLEDFGKMEQGAGQNGTIEKMDDRHHALIASSISKDENGEVKLLGENLVEFAKDHSFAYIVSSLFLGRKIVSKDTEELVDFILRISVDHGPYQSGALNTIVSARAGKDLVSSLTSGLLTIGPRFGGALNQAALNWYRGVVENISPDSFVEEFASKKIYIQGIGHKKYRIDSPDPRVNEIKTFVGKLQEKRFTRFAEEVEKITTEKKGNLILNVDGAIAAVLLDYLSEKEGYSDSELKELIEAEFFNALFVLSRSVGFIAHFLDQKRLDEGLLRLSEDDVADASAK